MKNFLVNLSLICLLSVGLVSCTYTDPDKATRVLEDQGYTNIVITGYNAWSCSEDDWYRTGFTATSIAGRFVEGTVCSSHYKGSTIRLD